MVFGHPIPTLIGRVPPEPPGSGICPAATLVWYEIGCWGIVDLGDERVVGVENDSRYG